MDYSSRSRRSAPVTILDLFSRPLEDFNDDRNRSHASSGDAIAVDVRDGGDCYILMADLPGVSKADITLDFVNGVLVIKAPHHQDGGVQAQNYLLHERNSGIYERMLAFEDVDSSGIEASFNEGMLTVILPKITRTSGRSSIQVK